MAPPVPQKGRERGEQNFLFSFLFLFLEWEGERWADFSFLKLFFLFSYYQKGSERDEHNFLFLFIVYFSFFFSILSKGGRELSRIVSFSFSFSFTYLFFHFIRRWGRAVSLFSSYFTFLFSFLFFRSRWREVSRIFSYSFLFSTVGALVVVTALCQNCQTKRS